MAQVNLGRVVGYSAYEIAVQEGFVGTEAEWLISLQGQDGATGATGPQGDDGTTFTPSVSSEGIISWTNDGGKVNPPSVNIKGPQGPQGATGPQGPAGQDGTVFTAGDGLELDTNDELNVKVDGTTIQLNNNNELEAIGGGSSYTAGIGIDIANNVISVDNNTVAMKSDIPAAELPTISSGDAGKALIVNTGETGVEWATVGGGSSYTAGDGIDITNDVISRIGITLGEPFFNIFTSGSISGFTLGNGTVNCTTVADVASNLLKGNVVTTPKAFGNMTPAQLNEAMGTNYQIRKFNFDSSLSNPVSYNNYNATATSSVIDYSNIECFIMCSNIIYEFTSLSVARSVMGYNLLYLIRDKQRTNWNSNSLYTILGNIDTLLSQKAEYPTIASGDAGKVLKVNSGETGVEWGTAGAESPLFRVDATDFSAQVYTQAVAAHQSGKLVLLDDPDENKYNANLLGVFNRQFDTTTYSNNFTESLSNLDFSDLHTALEDNFGSATAWLGLDNGDPVEFGFEPSEYSNGVLTKDWLEIDTVNNTINTNGEGTVTSFEITVFAWEELDFMAFNMIDCYNSWVNDNQVGVFDAINYQLLEDGRVIKNNVNITGSPTPEPPAGVPSLTRFVLNDGVQGDFIDLDNIEIAGYIDGDDKYHWDLEELTYSLDTERSYSYTFFTSSGDVEGTGSLTITQDGGDFVLEDGAVKMFATPGMGTIGLQYDQNYTAGE